jgi:two-component system, LytTR family, response regulator
LYDIIFYLKGGEAGVKAVLVDDEYYALAGLKMELESISGVEVVGMYEDGTTFLCEVASLAPDIIFLDIEMPEMSGMQLFQEIIEKKINAEIVFVTAYNQYALKAFELNAADYILKPANRARLLKTIERIKPAAVVMNDNKRITINCFQRLSILVNEEEPNFEWRTKKALELIAFLICEKGRFVSKERVAEMLWSEFEGEKGISNLYLAYHYIKKQEKSFGIVIPIESERGKMRLRINEVESDLIDFDQYLQKSKTITSGNIDFAEQAEGLYTGELFAEHFYEWAFQEQQKYEFQYETLLKKILQYHISTENREKIDYYTLKLKQIENI